MPPHDGLHCHTQDGHNPQQKNADQQGSWMFHVLTIPAQQTGHQPAGGATPTAPAPAAGNEGSVTLKK